MREAVFFGSLGGGAAADPDADGDGPHVRHGLGDDSNAVGQGCDFDIANRTAGRCHKGGKRGNYLLCFNTAIARLRIARTRAAGLVRSAKLVFRCRNPSSAWILPIWGK